MGTVSIVRGKVFIRSDGKIPVTDSRCCCGWAGVGYYCITGWRGSSCETLACEYRQCLYITTPNPTPDGYPMGECWLDTDPEGWRMATWDPTAKHATQAACLAAGCSCP